MNTQSEEDRLNKEADRLTTWLVIAVVIIIFLLSSD